MDKIVFKVTQDGSHTLYIEELDETYHSKHGAIQEAMHVFINAGLNHINKSKVSILEIGFGTGLNAYLTLLEAKDKLISYTSLEAFPLNNSIVEKLNYTDELDLDDESIKLFNKIHSAEWESYQKITPGFNLNKVKIELKDYNKTEKFDIIYFDAFGPRVQPKMWEKEIFEPIL